MTALDALARLSPEAREAALLSPLLCRDCDAWVPLGWIDRRDLAACPANPGLSHRVYDATILSAIDVAARVDS